MMRLRAWVTVVAILAGLAGARAPIAAAPASAAARTLTLTAGAGRDLGWIALTVRGPDGAAVDVGERIGRRTRTIARLSLRGGRAARRHAARWQCGRRERHLVATTRGLAGARHAAATITTPSCAGRLRAVVVPAQVRPGAAATVRIADAWGFGGISAAVCARPRARTGHAPAPRHARCRSLRLAPGATMRRARVALTRPGRWRITVGFGPLRAPFVRDVLVRRRARQRILVTGDSMILGLFEALGRKLGDRAAVQGDPHPGRGITTPGHFDWTGHARRSARAARPDVTVVFVGAADAGYPLRTLSGATVSCCEPAWVAAYARRVRRMMRSYARAGTGLVYWVLLPAPRSAAKARVFGAENSGVRRAAHGEASGVKVVDRIATVLTPHGRFGDRIVLAGRPQVVRDADGLHLSPAGIDIAADILLDALRTDGLAA